MKKIFTTLLISLVHQLSFGQGMQLKDINILSGRNFSSFIYKDSEGNEDNNMTFNALNNLAINFNLSSGRHIIRPEVSIRQAGARSHYNSTTLSWKMNYLDLNFAYLVNILESERYMLCPGIGLGAGYMFSGEQHIGPARYSITESGSLKPFDFGFQALTHFRVNITEKFAMTAEYRHGRGMNQIENDINAQKTKNIYHSALVGVSLRLK